MVFAIFCQLFRPSESDVHADRQPPFFRGEMGYWSYSALDGCNGQMILGYVPQKTLASVKGVPSIVDDPDDTRYADLNKHAYVQRCVETDSDMAE